MQSTERILSQTDLRLAGQTTIPDRMVSLSDPDARLIRKGKLGRPVEFGYKVMIIDNREGLIEGYEVYKGNPVDHELLVPRSPSIRRDRLSPRRGHRRPGFRDHQSRRRPPPARGAHLRHPPTGPDTPRTQTNRSTEKLQETGEMADRIRRTDQPLETRLRRTTDQAERNRRSNHLGRIRSPYPQPQQDQHPGGGHRIRKPKRRDPSTSEQTTQAALSGASN